MDAVTLAARTPAEEVSGLPDHGLIEAMVAARRLASQAQAVELAAVAELARRRRAEDAGSGHRALSPAEYLHDEVAGALTLTSNAADDLIRFATELTERLPETYAALSAGEIDYLKARTLWHGTDRLTPPLAAAIEAKVLPRAQAQTTGQIRAKIRRLVKQLDPETLDRRRTLAEQQRGVHLFETDDGTAHLTGTDLPTEAASAAYGRLNAIAAAIKNDGDKRGIDQLRADVFLSILRGTFTQPPAPQTTAPTDTSGLRPPTADTSETRSQPPDPKTPDDESRMDASAAVAERTYGTGVPRPPAVGDTTGTYKRSRSDGTAIADWTDVDDGIADLIAEAARTELSAVAEGLPYGHHGFGALIAQAATRISGSLADLKTRWCVPDHDRIGYRPPAPIRRLLEHRDRRCCAPGCRRPVRHCDADHSIPYHRNGPTCPCNLAMLCRRHHRLKQTETWQIHHIWPGVILWITPTGHWTITAPADRE